MDAPRVDFYLLDEPAAGGRDATACRIAEMAWRRGHRVHVHVDSPESARRLDDLLWTWRDESFVPHAVCGEGEDAGAETVTIGWGTLPRFADDVLLNLDARVPDGFERFGRILEVVDGEEASRAAGRDRFRTYRDQGREPAAHRLGSRG